VYVCEEIVWAVLTICIRKMPFFSLPPEVGGSACQMEKGGDDGETEAASSTVQRACFFFLLSFTSPTYPPAGFKPAEKVEADWTGLDWTEAGLIFSSAVGLCGAASRSASPSPTFLRVPDGYGMYLDGWLLVSCVHTYQQMAGWTDGG